MEAEFVTAIIVGCLASIAMNLGKGVQKMKVKVWLAAKDGILKLLAPENRGDFGIWSVGMLMTAGAGLLFTVALGMTDKSSIISSLNGVGLIALAIFSAMVLKEKVGLREGFSILLILSGTALVQYFNVSSGVEQEFSQKALFGCVGIAMAAFTVLVVITRVFKRGTALVYSAIAGTFLAIMMILFDIANVHGGPGLGKFLNLFFLVGFFMGNGAFLFTNLAFFHGTATMIVPTVNSFMILMPMVLEYYIFGVMLKPVQYAGVLVIVGGVILLTTGQSMAGQEAPDTAAEPAGA